MSIKSTGTGGASAAGSFPQGASNGLSNFTAQNTQYLRAGIARVRANKGTLKIALVGDSTINGFDSVSLNSGYTGARALSTPVLLAAALTAKGLPAQADSFFGNGNIGTLANFSAYYPALTGVSFITSIAAVSLGDGSFYSNSVSGASLAYVPITAFDTIDVYTLNTPANGSITVNVDGGATLATISTNSAAAYTKTTVTGASLATHTINVATTSTASVYVNGIAVRASTVNRTEIYSMGWNSATAANYAVASGSWRPLLALPIVAPDVTFINLTINDIVAATSVASFTTNIQALITAAQLSGDCILMVGAPGSAANFTNAAGAAIVNAIYSLAATNNIPVCDIGQRWISYAAANVVMPYNDNGTPALHPGGIGYADIASALSLFF